MNESPAIVLDNIGVHFGSHVVHRNISFQIAPGETVTLLGPSGTGKTIILKIILGLLRPDDGRVFVLDQELTALPEERIDSLRLKIGMLFQGAALFDSLSVYDNIAYGLRERGEKNEGRISGIVAEKLEIVGLGGIQLKFPAQLSGGQRKRVGLARALATSPEILLFDEPTTGLDPTARRMIDDLILRLRDDYGITSLVVTHDMDSARRISNRWILINEGRVLADGPVEEVLNSNLPVMEFAAGKWED